MTPEQGDYLFHIYTLGKFEIYSKGVRITEGSKRSSRSWMLFKYILANKSKMLSAGELIEAVWGDESCANPEKALQNLIYRLRNALSSGTGAKAKSGELILFSQGCYKWNENIPVWTDCDAMSEYAEKGRELMISSPYNSGKCFEKVIELYNGDFFAEVTHDLWVLPIRTAYRKIYSDSVVLLLEMMDRAGDFEAVVKVCGSFFSHEFFDEQSNMFYLRSMIALDRKKEALRHYRKMADTMRKELGIKLSFTFEDVESQARERPTKMDVRNIDLEFISDIMRGDEKISGAFQCDKDTFISISKIIMRNLERSGLSAMMALTTFSESGLNGRAVSEGEGESEAETARKTEAMSVVIEEARKRYAQSFRRGDSVCHWNTRQLLIMLININSEGADIVMQRINTLIKTEILKEGYDISCSIIPLEHGNI
jgi:DNA-binding SARP family transcriptional activator